MRTRTTAVRAAELDVDDVEGPSCLTTCDGTDKIKIWIQLGNIGAAPIHSSIKVKLEFKGRNAGEDSRTIPNVMLAAGEYGDALALEDVSIAGVTEINLTATPTEAECEADASNTITLMPPFCTPPG
ncbi:MAG: hypothetical protein R3B09_05710 [Nannocystaceae bacterium]